MKTLVQGLRCGSWVLWVRRNGDNIRAEVARKLVEEEVGSGMCRKTRQILVLIISPSICFFLYGSEINLLSIFSRVMPWRWAWCPGSRDLSNVSWRAFWLLVQESGRAASAGGPRLCLGGGGMGCRGRSQVRSLEGENKGCQGLSFHWRRL